MYIRYLFLSSLPFLLGLNNFLKDYCVNHGNAIKILQAIRQKRPEVAAHLQVFTSDNICTLSLLTCTLQRLRDDPSVRNLDLSSYLLAPSTSCSCND